MDHQLHKKTTNSGDHHSSGIQDQGKQNDQDYFNSFSNGKFLASQINESNERKQSSEYGSNDFKNYSSNPFLKGISAQQYYYLQSPKAIQTSHLKDHKII